MTIELHIYEGFNVLNYSHSQHACFGNKQSHISWSCLRSFHRSKHSPLGDFIENLPNIASRTVNFPNNISTFSRFVCFPSSITRFILEMRFFWVLQDTCNGVM